MFGALTDGYVQDVASPVARQQAHIPMQVILPVKLSRSFRQ